MSSYINYKGNKLSNPSGDLRSITLSSDLLVYLVREIFCHQWYVLWWPVSSTGAFGVLMWVWAHVLQEDYFTGNIVTLVKVHFVPGPSCWQLQAYKVCTLVCVCLCGRRHASMCA